MPGKSQNPTKALSRSATEGLAVCADDSGPTFSRQSGPKVLASTPAPCVLHLPRTYRKLPSMELANHTRVQREGFQEDADRTVRHLILVRSTMQSPGVDFH